MISENLKSKMQTIERPKMSNNDIKCSNEVLENPPTENTKTESYEDVFEDISVQYKSAGNVLENAVDSIVKCKNILSSLNDDKMIVQVLCKLKIIKHDLGKIIEDLQKNQANSNFKEIKVEESISGYNLDDAEFTDYKVETSDIDFESTSETGENELDSFETSKKESMFLKEELKSSNQDTLSCVYCKDTFDSNIDYEKHQRLCPLAKSFNCDFCDKSFPSEYGLNCHMGRKHPDALANFICDICGANFDNKKDFKAHKHVFKSELENIIICCAYCDKKFQSSSAYKLHLKNLHSKFHCCRVCQEAFHLSKDLIKHVKESHDGQIFSCEICKKEFASVKIMQRHMSEHSGHQCPSCGKKYAEAKSLKLHIKSHHSQKFECSVCSAAFDRKVDLNKHETEDHLLPRKVCPTCGYATNNSSSYASHLKIHGPKLFKCEVCAASFAKSSYLKTHSRIHTGERPYNCQVCGANFRKSSLLARHRIIHTGNKPFQCTLCGKGFNQKGNLKTHMKSHSSENKS